MRKLSSEVKHPKVAGGFTWDVALFLLTPKYFNSIIGGVCLIGGSRLLGCDVIRETKARGRS